MQRKNNHQSRIQSVRTASDSKFNLRLNNTYTIILVVAAVLGILSSLFQFHDRIWPPISDSPAMSGAVRMTSQEESRVLAFLEYFPSRPVLIRYLNDSEVSRLHATELYRFINEQQYEVMPLELCDGCSRQSGLTNESWEYNRENVSKIVVHLPPY